MKPTLLFFIVLALPTTMIATAASAASLYRWVDEKGEVHYTDSVPPEYAQKERRELNKQGVTVNQVEKAKSQEQLAQEQHDKEEAARKLEAEKKQRKLEQQRNRQLLDTYASEQDIIAARERNLLTLDGTISFSQTTLEKLHATLDQLNKNLTSAANDNARKKIQANIDMTTQQITDMKTFIKGKKNARDDLAKKFDEDLARFREIKASETNKPLP